MFNKKLIPVVLALIFLVPVFFGVSQVTAGYPSFNIDEVVTDKTVTLLTKDMPKDLDFKVLLGEYNTKGVDGIEVAQFDSGEGGSFKVTVDIPAALQGRAQISVRIESLTGGYYYYNWFWNKEEGGTWPETTPEPTTPPATPTPTPEEPTTPTQAIPTFEIKAVEAGKTVTIAAKDFPKSVDFVVRMGKNGTKGVDGIVAAEVTSSDTGAFEASFPIPADLADETWIAIRLDSKVGGWYSYNWFVNQTAQPAPEPTEEPTPEPTQEAPAVKYPSFSIVAVEKDKTVSIEGENFPKNTDFTVLMGKMWTMGIKGIESGSFNSGEGGDIQATFEIPAEFAGLSQIAIRLQGEVFYAYNWFWNSSTAE